jgi:hypothetical protein
MNLTFHRKKNGRRLDHRAATAPPVSDHGLAVSVCLGFALGCPAALADRRPQLTDQHAGLLAGARQRHGLACLLGQTFEVAQLG